MKIFRLLRLKLLIYDPQTSFLCNIPSVSGMGEGLECGFILRGRLKPMFAYNMISCVQSKVGQRGKIQHGEEYTFPDKNVNRLLCIPLKRTITITNTNTNTN